MSERSEMHLQAPSGKKLHQGAEDDPRRIDLERRVLSKLRRILPKLQVEYISSTSTGLFEQTREHYGEIWYELNGRKEMSRLVTADGVLETIYSVAAISPPQENEENIFRGHPLAVRQMGLLSYSTCFGHVWF